MNSADPRSPAAGSVMQTLLLCLVGAPVAMAAFRIGIFRHLGAELDSSWVAAVGEAAARGDVFGRDIIFTGGPLSSAYSLYFSPITWWWTMLWFLGVLILVVGSLVALRPGIAGVIAFAFAFFISNRDAAFLALPLLAVFPHFKNARLGPAVLLFGACMAAATSLAKFTVLPIAIFAFAAADAVSLSRRRLPLALPVFAASWLLLFRLTNGGLDAVPGFLLGSLDMAAGYSEAMSRDGPILEMALYLALALFFIGVAGWIELAGRGRALVAPVALLLTLSAYLFFTFKTGFVRHDLHSIASWSGIGIAAALFLCVVPAPGRVAGGIVLAVSLLGSSSLYAVYLLRSNTTFAQLVEADAVDLVGSARAIYNFTTSPAGWLANKMVVREHIWASVRTEYHLPAMEGTVDMIPSSQGVLIANGLNYRPRFSIQEYASYTPRLIAADKALYASAHPPDHVVFGTERLDNRYAAATEGWLWIDLLRFYVPTQTSGGFLVLHRRDNPVGELLSAPESRTAHFGKRFRIGGGRVFMKADIRPTLLGRLLTLAWRPPIITMDIRFKGGRRQQVRLIPGQAKDGFLLSPQVTSVADLAALWAGGDREAKLSTVDAITFRTTALGALAYRQNVRISTQKLDLSPLGERNKNNSVIVAARARGDRLKLLTDNARMRPAHIELSGEGLFAHAPSRIEVPVSGRQLRFGFGVRQTTRPKKTDGVCFRLLLPSGAKLWQRCLNPSKNPAHAGPKKAKITLPPDAETVFFETTCRSDCGYDWSYWSEARMSR